MTTTWLVRKSGSDSNGGTSKTVRSTGSDGVTNSGNNTLTSATAAWSAADIGHGININSNWRLITAVASAGSLTYSGASIATGSSRPWTVGGSFLTINKVAGSAVIPSAGDTCAVGAGTYRELLTLGLSGSAGNPITYYGDLDGVLTGDSGDVTLSPYLTNDTTAPSTSAAMVTIGGKSHIVWDQIDVLSSRVNTTPAGFISATTCDDITIKRCMVVALNGNDANFSFVVDNTTTVGITLDRVKSFSTGLTHCIVSHITNNTADYNVNFKATNCLLVGGNNGFSSVGTLANTFHGGGGLISFCTFQHVTTCVLAGSLASTVYPWHIYGCYAYDESLLSSGANPRGSLVTDYCFTAVTSAAAPNFGPSSITTNAYAPLQEFYQAYQVGRKQRPLGSPGVGSPMLGFVPLGLQMKTGIPTVATDDSAVGDTSWTNPNNSLVSDSVNATSAVLGGGSHISHYLETTGYGFAIPSDATILGIRARWTGLVAGSGTPAYNLVKLIKGGVVSGNDNSTHMSTISAGYLEYTSTVANDLWGLAWTPADINASNFGVAMSFKNTHVSQTSTFTVDYITATVIYTRDSAHIPTEQTIDLTNRARPAGGQTALAVGCMERGNTAVQEVSTVHTGSNAIKIAGPGYQDFDVPVDATTTTITAYMRYDGSYGGSTLPTMSVLNGTECGVDNASTSQVGASNTWEQVTLTLVPTSKGIVTISFSNLSTAAAGNVFVDTFGVS